MDPYDWSKENYFRELWIAEGSTSYMHNLLQVRNGMTSAHDYLLGLAASVRTERVRPGNRVQSLSECSVDSWVKFRRAGQDDINFETDLYEKGAQVSLCLDLEIRHYSGNKYSFDDLLHTLLRRFPLGSGGYTIDDVEQIAGELAGKPMTDFFAAFVHGVRPLEWDRVLAYAGLRIDAVDSPRKPALGVATNDQGGRTVVNQVISGFPAYRAGLNAGDEIIALDGFRVSTVQLADRIREHAVGDTVLVTVFRESILRSIPIVLDVVEYPTYTVRRLDNPTTLQRTMYTSWLNNPW